MVAAQSQDSLLALVDFILQCMSRRWKMIKPSTKETETKGFSEETVFSQIGISQYELSEL